MVDIETKIDNALAYILHLARHIPKKEVSIATLALLIEMGFKTNTDGFCYLRSAILLKTEHPLMRFQELYMIVGKSYGVTWKQVERTLRHAIGSAWKRRDPELWGLFFSEQHLDGSNHPTDSLFIAQMACVMELWQGCCKEVGCSG